MKLGVNIDHVATLRQARYSGGIDAHNAEPDVVAVADLCERSGANGITVHLRADRRHIQDADVFRLRERIRTKLNLEMGNTPEIVEIALRVKPAEVCLVPENRREVTTEGGLDVEGQFPALEPTLGRLRGSGIRVSMFVEPAMRDSAAYREFWASLNRANTRPRNTSASARAVRRSGFKPPTIPCSIAMARSVKSSSLRRT